MDKVINARAIQLVDGEDNIVVRLKAETLKSNAPGAVLLIQDQSGRTRAHIVMMDSGSTTMRLIDSENDPDWASDVP
jgi:hypothetical protein